LRTLSLGWDSLGAQAIEATLGNASNLHDLALYKGFDSSGALGHLANGLLSERSAVTKLHIETSIVRREKARDLSRILHSKKLKSLSLALNAADAAGYSLIATRLEENTVLENLDLIGGNMGVDGANAISGMLTENTTL